MELLNQDKSEFKGHTTRYDTHKQRYESEEKKKWIRKNEAVAATQTHTHTCTREKKTQRKYL